jgi:type IV secretory pathway TraG/TraD family ATPase VirD4
VSPVLHDGKAHCLSIGQTGSGKTNLMIANLLLWEGSAIVIDVRGDAMARPESGSPW